VIWNLLYQPWLCTDKILGKSSYPVGLGVHSAPFSSLPESGEVQQ